MRNLLLTSTAAVCLVLTTQVGQAQTTDKTHEQKTEHSQQAPASQQSKPGGHASTTGQTAGEKSNQNKNASENPNQNTTKGNNAQSKPGQQNNKSANQQKPNESNRTNAQNKQTPNEAKKSNAAGGSNKAAGGKSQTNTAGEQKPGEANKANAQNNQTPNETNKAAGGQNQTNTAGEQNKNANPANANAANGQKAGGNNASTAQTPNNTRQNNRNAATQSNTNSTSQTNQAVNQSGNLDPQKRVRISETISRHRDLAPPERDLNISIRVGERIPSRIRLHPLPTEIVTIAPEYRGYDYFTTEQDVVIVSPRTHEIVTRIPRDVSRARAEGGGGGSAAMTAAGGAAAMTATGGGGGMPCQVMQRTASGEMNPVNPSQLRQTTGSGGGADRLAVRVQAPNGQQMPEVALQAREGRIIAETNGNDCRIILESGSAQ